MSDTALDTASTQKAEITQEQARRLLLGADFLGHPPIKMSDGSSREVILIKGLSAPLPSQFREKEGKITVGKAPELGSTPSGNPCHEYQTIAEKLHFLGEGEFDIYHTLNEVFLRRSEGPLTWSDTTHRVREGHLGYEDRITYLCQNVIPYLLGGGYFAKRESSQTFGHEAESIAGTKLAGSDHLEAINRIFGDLLLFPVTEENITKPQTIRNLCLAIDQKYQVTPEQVANQGDPEAPWLIAREKYRMFASEMENNRAVIYQAYENDFTELPITLSTLYLDKAEIERIAGVTLAEVRAIEKEVYDELSETDKAARKGAEVLPVTWGVGESAKSARAEGYPAMIVNVAGLTLERINAKVGAGAERV